MPEPTKAAIAVPSEDPKKKKPEEKAEDVKNGASKKKDEEKAVAAEKNAHKRKKSRKRKA